MSGTVILRHGGETPQAAVQTIMLNLRVLLDEQPIAFYELVQVCRNRDHVPFGDTAEVLTGRGLLERDGRPHRVVRDVVLSAARGEEADLHLGSPLAGDES